MHLHNSAHNTVIMSPLEDELTVNLQKIGVSVYPSQCVRQLRENEQYHADMQISIIDDTAFIPEDCTQRDKVLRDHGYNIIYCKALSGKYPDNISLNVALIGNKLFCKESAVDVNIKDFCATKGIQIVNVNQGYTKCSTLILNDNAIVTADETIYRAAQNNHINALKITAGNIYLQNADYGFIGGCSGVIGDTVYFFGNINTHPQSAMITDFISTQGMNIISLTDGIMKDIGGFVCI